MDLQWEEIDRTHDQALQEKEGEKEVEEVVEVIEGQMTTVGNHTLQTQAGDILVRGEAGGDRDEDTTGHGPEIRNLTVWQESPPLSLFLFIFFHLKINKTNMTSFLCFLYHTSVLTFTASIS